MMCGMNYYEEVSLYPDGTVNCHSNYRYLGKSPLPSLSQAREKSKTAVCLSNLKQSYFATNVFTLENKGKLPGPIWATMWPLYKKSSNRLATFIGVCWI